MSTASGITGNPLTDGTGNSPDVSNTLNVKNRTISNVDQAVQVCETLQNDWKKGIANAARITAKLNGERPYNQGKLKAAGKDWKSNISTGFLQTECNRVLPRLYMPLKTAKYLTSSSLPPDWPEWQVKTTHYRQTITTAIRRWVKFNFFIRGLAREVGIFGFGFPWFPDKYDWKPTLIRMDRGFVPQGTEIMETEIPFFMVKYDYKPSELLNILKESIEAGREEWNKENTVKAINGAIPVPVDATYPNLRTYEDLVRQAIWAFPYVKGAKTIQTWHLYARETTGKVSHYILLADNYMPQTKEVDGTGKTRLLYEHLDEFDSMRDVVNPVVFEYGDGTVHGSWGAGQILYDLAAQVEKVRCDSIDNMRMTNKMKLQVPDAKNVNDVKLSVNDTMVIASGATFAGNTAGISQDISGYEILDQKLTRIAQEKIGAFVPDIPTQPSDVKAAQINAALAKEMEIQMALTENWMIQNGSGWLATAARRLVDPESTSEDAKEVRKKLLEKLTDEEIEILSTQEPLESISEFTEIAAQKRGMFAASVMNNPLFRQTSVAKYMAEGAGDEAFVQSITVPEGDETDKMRAVRAQMVETSAFPVAIHAGQGGVPVVADDNDWVHMETLKPEMEAFLQNNNLPLAQVALDHFAAHYAQGVAKKNLPKDQINSIKQYIASFQKNLEARVQQEQIKAQQQQAAQQAEAIAQQIVQSEAGAQPLA